jgi:hypothetical protein
VDIPPLQAPVGSTGAIKSHYRASNVSSADLTMLSCPALPPAMPPWRMIWPEKLDVCAQLQDPQVHAQLHGFAASSANNGMTTSHLM